MPSLLDPDARRAFRQRSLALRPETPARWGSFSAPQMLSHVIQSLRVMVGEIEMPPEHIPWLVGRAPLKHLLIYVLPFPKGLPTSAVLLEREAADPATVSSARWQDELRLFSEALHLVGTRAPDEPWPYHAGFGSLTGRQWGVLQHRHLDHHFRQFGI